MSAEMEIFDVPPALLDEVAVAADVLREQLSRQASSAVEVHLVRPRIDGLTAGEVTLDLLAIPAPAVAILTKKWLEEVVWPELKKRIEKPTRDLLDYLFSLVPSRDDEDGP